MLQQYNALIIDSDLNHRLRLKQATTALPVFGKVRHLSSLSEALRILAEEEPVDIVFVARGFGPEKIGEFIGAGKKMRQGVSAAYVVMLRGDRQEAAEISARVSSGADALLFEPYSVECLSEIANLAAEVKTERAAARERLMLELVLKDTLNQLDLVAYLLTGDCSPGKTLSRLRELAGMLRQFSPQALAEYERLLLDLTIDAPLPEERFKGQQYAGVSTRIKKRLREKLKEEQEATVPAVEEAATAAQERQVLRVIKRRL